MINGKSKSIRVITDAELKANGGKYSLMNGPALPVAVVSDEGGIAGPQMVVYERTSGPRYAGPAIKVSNTTSTGKESTAGPAIPVIVISGSL